jgi:probable rRNA maturation factor
VSVRLAAPAARTGLPRIDHALLRRRARRILTALGSERAELSILLVDDAAIAELNQRYRGRSRPTDVLAFSLLEGAHADRRGALLGDVVIGIETAARQARARRRTLDDEVARLLVHGALHLLGYDHETDAGQMALRQAEVLELVDWEGLVVATSR